MIRKVLVVGGDGRMLALASLLQKRGYQVDTMGLLPNEQADIEAADAILLPYPFSVKDGKIPSLTGQSISLETVLNGCRENALMIAGNGVEVGKRYTQAEGFEQRNADLSAEAAVYEVMQRSERALMDLQVLVTGYGRFGRSLARKLHALGAEVFVAARRSEALSLVQEEGMHPVRLDDLQRVLPQVDFLLNTIPSQFISESDLTLMKPDAWLLELASAPYGFDRLKADQMGLKTALFPGLPARYAYQSAALALQDAVLTLFKEAEQ